MTPRQAANRLCVEQSTLRRWYIEGRLADVEVRKTMGGQRRYKASDIEHLAEQLQQHGVATPAMPIEQRVTASGELAPSHEKPVERIEVPLRLITSEAIDNFDDDDDALDVAFDRDLLAPHFNDNDEIYDNAASHRLSGSIISRMETAPRRYYPRGAYQPAPSYQPAAIEHPNPPQERERLNNPYTGPEIPLREPYTPQPGPTTDELKARPGTVTISYSVEDYCGQTKEDTAIFEMAELCGWTVKRLGHDDGAWRYSLIKEDCTDADEVCEDIELIGLQGAYGHYHTDTDYYLELMMDFDGNVTFN